MIKVLLDPIPRNLRKIKRVINCFRFLAFLANRKNLLADKTIALYDLGAITILSLEYPEIYNLLFHEIYHETIKNFLSAIENGLGSAQEKTKKDFEQRGIYIDQYKGSHIDVLLSSVIELSNIEALLSLSSTIEK